MNCIVTGGAGFIGSNLVDHLLKLKHKVKVLDNLSTGQISNLNHVKNKISFKKIDITNSKKLSKEFKNTDWVFHLAGLADIVPSINNPRKYFNANVEGTLKVLEAAKENRVKKFIYAGSASCYGIPKQFPTDENSIIDVQYPYALTKYLGEKIVLHWSNIYDMHNISLRFFNAYGPRSRTTGAYGAVFGVFMAQKLANKPLTIVGNGKQTRDFIHVYDLVKAIEKAARFGKKSNVYNLGSGKETNINFIAKLVGGAKIYIPKRPGEPLRSLAKIAKAKRDLRWAPKIQISNGVKMMLENINYWKKAPVWTSKKIKKATKAWFKYLSKNGKK